MFWGKSRQNTEHIHVWFTISLNCAKLWNTCKLWNWFCFADFQLSPHHPPPSGNFDTTFSSVPAHIYGEPCQLVGWSVGWFVHLFDDPHGAHISLLDRWSFNGQICLQIKTGLSLLEQLNQCLNNFYLNCDWLFLCLKPEIP